MDVRKPMSVSIAMVCMGNICRSPIAEHVMRGKAEAAGLDVLVESAGTGGWHAGEPADHRAVAVLEQHGYTSQHRAQQFSVEWFDRFDYIIVMDAQNFSNVIGLARTDNHISKVKLLRSFDPNAPKGAVVPDPYYDGHDAFVEVLRMVEAACDGLIGHLANQ